MAVDLTGWSLTSADGLNILLSGAIPANGVFLLERQNDTTILDVTADQIFTGAIADTGTTITLTNTVSDVIDTANIDGGAWPAGAA